MKNMLKLLCLAIFAFIITDVSAQTVIKGKTVTISKDETQPPIHNSIVLDNSVLEKLNYDLSSRLLNNIKQDINTNVERAKTARTHKKYNKTKAEILLESKQRLNTVSIKKTN